MVIHGSNRTQDEAGCENSQPAKFYRLQNFRNVVKFCLAGFWTVYGRFYGLFVADFVSWFGMVYGMFKGCFRGCLD